MASRQQLNDRIVRRDSMSSLRELQAAAMRGKAYERGSDRDLRLASLANRRGDQLVSQLDGVQRLQWLEYEKMKSVETEVRALLLEVRDKIRILRKRRGELLKRQVRLKRLGFAIKKMQRKVVRTEQVEQAAALRSKVRNDRSDYMRNRFDDTRRLVARA